MAHFRKNLHILSPVALVVVLSLSPVMASERQLHSHEHGVSELKIAKEGGTISFELEAPGDDIVGFEYAPKSDAEKAAVKAALATFEKPDALFAIAESANCSLVEKDAEFETSKDHAGFHVKWSVKCENIDKAKSMKVEFFNTFANAKEVEVEAVGSAGQMSAEVEKGQTTVDLSTAFGS